MTQDEVYAWLLKVLQETFDLDPGTVRPDATLADLDLDSIDAVDVVVRFKELTGKRVQPEAFKSVRTVQDVVEVLHALVRG
jgi:acyl carrier protein